MIWQFIQLFTKEKIIDEHELLKQGYVYFLCNPNLKKIVLNMQNIRHVGVLLGKEYPNGFFPSIELLQRLAPCAEKTVTLHEKGAWLFICGRDLWSESITNSAGKPEANDLVLVKNEHGEAIGVGKVVQKISARGLVVKNLFDIGWFARKKARAIQIENSFK